MIRRDVEPRLRHLATLYPVVTVTGPRQSGKTTLCRAAFPSLPYVSLEPLDVRESAVSDPRGFLSQYAGGAVIDEVQHAPDLLSYLQAEVDERPAPGRFVLTGSQQLGLSATVSQSLAGRTGVVELFPPSWAELKRFESAPMELLEVLWSGAYPRIYDRGIPSHQWIADYVATYVQRDVRQLLAVGDLRTFTDYLRLAAGRTACEVNLSRMGADAGISHNTARSWLFVLEASYLVFRLPGWHSTIRKRVTKAPKLHFVDTGLLCYLLGIREPEQLRHHPLRGAIFETWVAAEIQKRNAHAGEQTSLYHYRDASGTEVDLVADTGVAVILAEAKAGATVATDFFESLDRLGSRLRARPGGPPVEQRIVYGGSRKQVRADTLVLPWLEIDSVTW
jgi:hypothetical protein